MNPLRNWLYWAVLLLGLGGPLRLLAGPPAATARLATLAQVWGVLKYHHPRVARGTVDWDSVLVAAVPRVQAATTAAAFERELLAVCEAAGPVALEMHPTTGPALPAAQWVQQSPQLGPLVRARLVAVLQAFTPQPNNYVATTSQGQEVGYATFEGEIPYKHMIYPTTAYRLLALFRFWNAIAYFYPYKQLIGQEWDRVLTAYIPRFAQAADTLAYHQVAEKLVAELHDSHGLASSRVLSRQLGWSVVPFTTKQLGGRTVISRRLSDSLAARANVHVGDVLTQVDGVAIEQLRARYKPRIAASTPGALERDASLWALRGAKNSTATLGLRRGAQTITTTVPRFRYQDLAFGARYGNKPTTRHPGWQWLNAHVGYLDLDRLAPSQVDSAMQQLHTAEALVIDVRNYPAWPMPYKLLAHLYAPTEPFIAFEQVDLRRPGAWYSPPDPNPRPAAAAQLYQGRLFILVDESTQSLAEMTVMALQHYPRAVTVGSPTAGANGNVTSLVLPGNIFLSFTGLRVHYPDGTPTQRRGIKLDVSCRPTSAGLVAGRDEVLERALKLARTYP